jgi:hypothetical protein
VKYTEDFQHSITYIKPRSDRGRIASFFLSVTVQDLLEVMHRTERHVLAGSPENIMDLQTYYSDSCDIVAAAVLDIYDMLPAPLTELLGCHHGAGWDSHTVP